jgi:hypothetical protein
MLGAVACAPGPKGVVEKFYKAVEAGNMSEALDQVSSRVIQTIGRPKLEQALLSQNATMRRAGGLKSVDFQGEDVSGEVARVPVRITLNNGQTQQLTVTLVKEQGAWKIDLTAK